MLREELAELFDQESLAMVVAGNITAVLIGALIWMILAGVLPVEDYGRANYILSLGTFLSTFPLLGLNVTLRAYLPRGKEELLAPSVLLTSALSLLIGVPFMGLHPALPLIVFSNSVFILLTSERLGHLKYRDFFILQTITRLLQLLLILLLVPLFGLEGAVYSITLPFTLFSLQMLRRASGGFKGIRELLKYFRFSLLSYLSGAVASMGTRFDKVMIGTLYGDRVLGHYQLAFQFYSAMQALPTSLSSYILPLRSSGRSTKLQEILGLLLSIMAAVAGFLLIPLVIEKLFPSFYPESAYAGSIVSLAVVVDSLYGISSAKRLSAEDPLSVLISSLISLPLLFSSIYLLGSSLGVRGLAISLLIYRASALATITLTGALLRGSRR
ncbi:MAG: oligosaccharide flippase family protein [Candidatus Korarchaeum sp.]